MPDQNFPFGYIEDLRNCIKDLNVKLALLEISHMREIFDKEHLNFLKGLKIILENSTIDTLITNINDYQIHCLKTFIPTIKIDQLHITTVLVDSKVILRTTYGEYCVDLIKLDVTVNKINY